ncbi:MAG: homocysteine S-methyltransferase family protein [Candidatus Omnitrophota bacterium]|nr:homocysteine S-methyltransferase family protein [Candidatus Omnitrophota bacterium]
MKSLRNKMETDVLLFDGAFGTYVYQLGLKEEDFGGKTGCMEYLSVACPDFVKRIHTDYLKAGSDAVETNTFGGNALKLAEYGLSGSVYDINLSSTKLARSAADEFSGTSGRRYVIGTMGPTGKLPSSTDPELGDITFDELKKIYHDQALGIIDGGADALLVETGQDLLEMKAAVAGAKEALGKRNKDLVLMAQCTLANNGRMLLGTDVSAVMATMAYMGVDVVGLNCSTGPVEMEGALKFLSENCPVYFSCVPNAGLPVEVEGRTVYPLKPSEMADIMARFVRKYRLDVIGGCCGTGPEHILHMRKAIPKYRKREIPGNRFYASFYRGYDLKGMKRPIKVGERINTQGSRKMKELLVREDYDGIVELGKKQQRSGAGILDVCSVLSERQTEKRDAVILTRRLAESVLIPLMIDSTDTGVIGAALRCFPGTAFINSVNLEDGGEKARKVYALAKEYASFVVNLVIDGKGMAKTVDHKLEVAERLYGIAVNEYGLEPHRLLFDMLTFTLGTGEKEYSDAAVNTYKAIKELKKRHPETLTVLGVSNISFGLAKEARGPLNMVFLHHAVRNGLDMAIVNPSEFIEYKRIPAKERKLAEDLVFDRGGEALNRFVEYFAGKKDRSRVIAPPVKPSELTIEEKLKNCVLDRDKVNIIPLVDEAMKKYSPEDVVNVLLMDAMKQVGDKLDRGEMVLPYVLQSAEVMRKAIEYLKTFLPKDTVGRRGKVLLATVFGDVHDIGKNLVKMILQNNGFTVIDLGKQVPVEKIVEEAKKNKVDAVGLSALLVSTARHMKTCVQSMYDAGLEYPIMLGGAPVNRRFAKEVSALKDESIYKGGVFYARDVFTGLKIMQALSDPSGRKEAMEAYYRQFEESGERAGEGQPEITAGKKPGVKGAGKKPKAPFYGIRPLSNIPADEVFAYLNEDILFDLAWGAKLKDEKEKERVIEEEYRPLLEELKEEALRKRWLDLKAVYGYFKCRVLDERMEVLDGSGKVLETIGFSRPGETGGRGITDFFSNEPEGYDIVAFQAVTVGGRVNEAIGELNAAEEPTRAFFLHGLSVHLAEALAAYVHDKIRQELGLKKEQGKRYSPGYPLWKRIDDQEKIFRLLEVERRLSVRLTEGYQMVPEQSTTAMIVYNDEAEY